MSYRLTGATLGLALFATLATAADPGSREPAAEVPRTEAEVKALQVRLKQRSDALRGENAALQRRVDALERGNADLSARKQALDARLNEVLERVAKLEAGPGN